MTPKTPAGDTPVIRQYREIKAEHPNSILFFRMGDFYEMFFEDAETASAVLGLTLTTRNNGAAADVPLAGIPVKAANDYLRRLVERGYRVAICEQVEDPKSAKGIVRRAVVETVTPGAVLADNLLDGTSNNFLVSVLPGPSVGIAAIDVSTGEFVMETVPESLAAAAVERYAPREVVAPQRGAGDLAPEGTMVTLRDDWEFDAAFGTEDLTRRFDLATLDGLGVEEEDRPAVAAAGALLRYLTDLQPGGLPQIGRPSVRRAAGIMALDEMTRRNLELVTPLRVDGRSGTTVFDLLNTTRTAMGARLLRSWILAPLTVRSAIEDRHDGVSVLVGDARGRGRLRDALNHVRDIERLAGRAAAGRSNPRELGALRDSLAGLPDVLSALDGLGERHRSSLLEDTAANFDLLADLQLELAEALVDRPPVALGEQDAIRSGTDSTLDEARDLRDGGKQYIATLQQREREATSIPSLKVGYNRVFGYYIEVTKTHRDRVPDHYERRQTLTNAERYITPELKEYEQRVLGAEEQALAREREIIEQLLGAVHRRLRRLQAIARLIARLDVLAAFADVAVSADYVRPTMTDGRELDLRRCRHPVVERMLPHGKFIPNDLRLDEASRVMLLTGPNMAGKSTILRQVGLCVILAQIGSFIPASEGTIGIVDRVFTRVGASDDLSRGQSTFMVEMSETSAILHGASETSLILLDEIGRGTSTYDGVAIAWSVTEHVHNVVGAKTVFATHYHELTQLTEELQHACNYNVAVRELGDDIVFLHRLTPGGADRSYGIQVAQLAGLPGSVLERARDILRRLEAGHHVTKMELPPDPDPRQLGLFEASHPVVEELRTVDPDRLTPLEALALLATLKRKVDET